ncbi:MAG: c-type cytochrome [Steroidobacteraceae bacterium]
MALQWLRSGMRSGALVAAAVCGVIASASVTAQEPTSQGSGASGNPQRGKALSYTCLGCHGVDGYKNAYPNYSVPELEGQHPEYLAAALKEYRDGDRAHLTMHAQASSLSDQDIADVVSYFAGKPLTADSKPEGTVPAPAQLCTSCHGANGVGITPQYPTLAGQHPDYIVRALEEYKKGGRKNPIMAGMAATVKDEDMAIIADYFSKQRPSLATESRPYTSFGNASGGK